MKISSNYLLIGFLLMSVLLSFFYIFGEILRPFIFGFILAYFLDPLADKIEKLKIPRSFAALFLILVAFFIFIIFFLFILPVFYRQFYQFFQILPIFYDWSLKLIENNLEIFVGKKIIIDENIKNFQNNIKDNIGFIFESFLSSTMSIFNFILNSFITLILTFYLLVDWDRLVFFISKLVPKSQKKILSKILIDIELVLSKLFRGQLLVCLILSIYYGILLFLIGLEAGLFLGVFAGLISFVPFIGAIVGGSLALLLGIFQFYENPVFILLILIVFIIGQIIEGNFLTPKLVGSSAGIHPILLILSLALFGKIGGITGLILALPITAISGVFARYFLKTYYSSTFYNSKGN